MSTKLLEFVVSLMFAVGVYLTSEHNLGLAAVGFMVYANAVMEKKP